MIQKHNNPHKNKHTIADLWEHYPNVQIALKTSMVESLNTQLHEENAKSQQKNQEYLDRWWRVEQEEQKMEDILDRLDHLILLCSDKRKAQQSIETAQRFEEKEFQSTVNRQQRSIQTLTKCGATLVTRIECMSAVPKFLKEAAEVKGFKAIREFLHHAHNLLDVRENMSERISDTMHESIVAKRRLAWAIYWQIRTSLRQSQQWTTAQERQDALGTEIAQLEKLLIDAQERTQARCKNFAKIQSCVINLYHELPKTLLIVPVSPATLSEQIRSIPFMLQELKKMCSNIRNDYLVESDDAVVEPQSQN